LREDYTPEEIRPKLTEGFAQFLYQ
jgi:hypothetical protein